MNEREPHYRNVPPEALPRRSRAPIHVVLDNLRSAFNVGSIFRTSDAGAVEQIYLCGMTPYPPNARLARTALGATDYVAWEYRTESTEALEELRAKGIKLVAIETGDDATSHLEFDWPERVAIVFGHEVRGIAPEALAMCEARVRIPMLGHKNTINVATAFGIVLYDILRRRGALDADLLGRIEESGTRSED